MNELSDLLLALIDLRINTQLNNSNFLRKYNGYVVGIEGENVKVMMDFTEGNEDTTKAYTFINKTGSTNIKLYDNVEIICNKDFNNGYVNKNLSLKQIAVTTEYKSDNSLTVSANGLSKDFDLSKIIDSAASIAGKSVKLSTTKEMYFAFGSTNGTGVVEFRGTDFNWDDDATLTHLHHNIVIKTRDLS